MADADAVRSAYDAWNRGDVDALLAYVATDIEIEPLVGGVASVGPWRGYDGVRRLFADIQGRWTRFDVHCEQILPFGERFVALVHIETAAGPGSPVVSGDIAHLIETRDGLFTRFTAYRDRDAAVAAAHEEDRRT